MLTTKAITRCHAAVVLRWARRIGVGAVLSLPGVVGLIVVEPPARSAGKADALIRPLPVPAQTPGAARAHAVPIATHRSRPPHHEGATRGPRVPDIDRVRLTESSPTRFMALYKRASGAFGVNWRLIASIHQQETGFSSARGTYHGLNFARCCAGPMQFNVTNGPVSTWARFSRSFTRAERPARYPHRMPRHPSVYDDFGAIRAAGALMDASGAGSVLDGTAWRAAYDYYGHDETGLGYADQVLARAVGWTGHGVCVRCVVDPHLISRFDAAFAAPYRAELTAAARRNQAEAEHKRHKGHHRHRPERPRHRARHRRPGTRGAKRAGAKEPSRPPSTGAGTEGPKPHHRDKPRSRAKPQPKPTADATPAPASGPDPPDAPTPPPPPAATPPATLATPPPAAQAPAAAPAQPPPPSVAVSVETADAAARST